jgi:hypothetical protein
LRSVAVGNVVFPRNLQTCSRSKISILDIRSAMEPIRCQFMSGTYQGSLLSLNKV